MLSRIKQESLVWVAELIKGDTIQIIWDGEKVAIVTNLLPIPFASPINTPHFEHTAKKFFDGRKVVFHGRMVSTTTPDGKERNVFFTYDIQLDGKYLDVDTIISMCLTFGMAAVSFTACLPSDEIFARHLQKPSNVAECMGRVAPRYGIFIKPMRELENDKGTRIVREILNDVEPAATIPEPDPVVTKPQVLSATEMYLPKPKTGRGKKK